MPDVLFLDSGPLGAFSGIADAVDKYEPNNSFAAATDLGTITDAAQFVESDLTIDANNVDDYFKFTLSDYAGPGSYVRIDFVSEDGDVDLYIYDSSEIELDYSTGSEDFESIDISSYEPGLYYIQINKSNWFDPLSLQYELTINIEPTVEARLSVDSPLGASTPLATHDFTEVIGDATTYYVMDLTTPGGTVRVPISSWQATLQTGLSNYVQCVVPAVSAYVSAINSATQFKISRLVDVPGLAAPLTYEMATAPVQTTTFDQGPFRYTCTISGYSTGFAPNETPPAAYNRIMQGIRSISINQGGTRVRCSIDWLLRPSQRVFASSEEFVVSYINYYVGDGDAYMEVGERA